MSLRRPLDAMNLNALDAKKNVNWKALLVIVVTFDVDIYFNCIHSHCFV